MEDITDVIHRIAYDVDDRELKDVQNTLGRQLSTLEALGKRQLRLAEIYKKAGASDDATRKRANALLKQNAQNIEAVGRSLEKTILTNKQFNQALTQEIGLVNTLSYRLDILEKRRKSATSVAEVQRYNKLIQKEQAKIQSLSPGGQAKSGGGGLGFGAIARFAAPVAAGAVLVNFAKEIFNVTAKFEAYNNTLKNTFQSSQKAAESFELIKQFAAATPFSVDQVTASYIKLVNRGFEPTKENLTEIGDLAASQGKSFDQLVEALLDAQTGEFERLKEFGIKAKTVGDTVTLSFKGVEKQVKKTDQEGLRNAILSFGKMSGVVNSMSTVAQGLTGKVSNLGDSFDALKAAIGSRNGGIFAGILDTGKDVLDFFTNLVEIPLSEKLREEQIEVNSLANAIVANNGNRLIQNQLIAELNSKYPEFLRGLNAEADLTQAINERLSVYNQLATQRINLAIQQGVVDKNQKDFSKALSNTAKEASRVQEILFKIQQFAEGDNSAISAREGKVDEALTARARLKALLPELKKIRTTAEYKAFVKANQELFDPLSIANDDFKVISFRDRNRSVLKESLEAIKNEEENTGDLTEAQKELNFAKQQAADAQKENSAENLKLLEAERKKLVDIDVLIKKSTKEQKPALENQRAAILANINDLERTLGLLKAPPPVKPTATTPKGGKKKTAAEAQKELLEEFQADLRKSLIRDEVQDFIRASQDIEADRKKRLDKIEKLEKEFKQRFDKARKTSDEIVQAELLRDREAYETKRRKLIEDNEDRIADLTRDAELKRAQIIKASFAIETELLRRELKNQETTVNRDRDQALKKLREDAEKGLFGNLERAKDGINLPRNDAGEIIIRFVKVDAQGNPIKNADGTFQEDIEATEKFQKQVTATNNYYNTLNETNTAAHFDKLLDLQLKYHALAQNALVDALQAQNVDLQRGFSEQFQAITDQYLQGKISAKEYVDFVAKENKRLAKEQLQAQLDNLTGGQASRRNLRRGFNIGDITGGRVGDINKALTDGGFTGKDAKGNKVFTPLDEEARNKLLKERLDLEQQILDILVKQNEQRGKDKQDADDKKKASLLEIVSAYEEIGNAALNAANTTVQALQQQTEREISIRETRVDRARQIADRGNAEALEAEENRLTELQAKQERFARIQLGINNLLTLSNSIAAVAKAAAEGGVFAPATIAAVIAALVAGFSTVQGFSRDLPAFREGVVDYKGAGTPTSDSNTVRISNRESVMTAEATANNKSVLQAMNKGAKFDVARVGGLKMLVPRDNQATPILGGVAAGGYSDKKIAAKLDEVKGAIEGQAPSSFSMDRRGIVAIVREVMSQERKRWKV